MYCRLECVQEAGTRSPVVFIHGFPDSPLMFTEYMTADEQGQPWLRDRQIYTIAFPNRFTNPAYPSLGALVREPLQPEVDALLSDRIAASPTGKIIIVAHDWGATCTWKFVRTHPDLRGGIEALVALSVASSFRYDVWEHGLRAIGWAYSALFGLPYYVRVPAVQRFVARMIVERGGYQSDQNDTLHMDTYHYWYGVLRPFLLPFDLIGLRARPAFLDFAFPVLYIRSPIDRLPSTAAFERAMAGRPNCRMVVLEGVNHWFPEQHPQRVLGEIRAFFSQQNLG